MACCVCLKSAEDPLEVFDTKGYQLNIANILQQHFWFRLLADDSNSKVICTFCWAKISDFHQFYISVEQAHFSLCNKSEYTPEDAPVKEECDVEECDVSAVFAENLYAEPHAMDDILENNWHEVLVAAQKPTINPLYEPELMQSSDGETEALHKSKDKCLSVQLDEVECSLECEQKEPATSERKTRRRAKMVTNCPKNESTKTKQSRRRMITPKDDEMIAKHIPMGCDLCTFVGEDFTQMCQHFRLQHKEHKPYVKCCGRKLSKRFLLVQHAYKHEDPEFFKCQQCDKIFADSYVLRSHMLANHASYEELTFECDQCPKRFSRRYLLDLHKPSHIPVNERKFICTKCPLAKAFASDHLLQIHTSMRHTKATNVCHVCAKEIRDNQAFEKHVRLHFEDSGPRVKCPRPNCDRWLKDDDNLKQHLRRHHDDGKTFTCDECGRVCKNRRSLTSHLNYAHTKEVFACEECNKTFKKAITLKEHMAQHTGESLYKCPFCMRTFNSNANMHSHKKKMHPVEWDIWRKTKRGSSQHVVSNKIVMESMANNIN